MNILKYPCKINEASPFLVQTNITSQHFIHDVTKHKLSINGPSNATWVAAEVAVLEKVKALPLEGLTAR